MHVHLLKATKYSVLPKHGTVYFAKLEVTFLRLVHRYYTFLFLAHQENPERILFIKGIPR